MKIFSIVLATISISLILNSCEKLLIEQNGENTPINNFDFLWDELDKGYPYFDYKSVNWDSIKVVYRSKVSNLLSDDELFELLAEMLETLKDGHISIRQNIMYNRSFDVTEGYQDNFNKEFVIENYLVPNDMDTTTWIRHCFLNEDIGYLYYSTFTNEISKNGMEEILAKYKDTKGLIIDVRGNYGGDASNILRLMEHFVSVSTLVGYSQEKTGEGRSELGAKREILIDPYGTFYSKPIMVLSNRQSYSATNAFIGYMSILPNVTVVGDYSGGGAGLPVTNQLWNGWFFTYSSTIGSLPNGFITENGIEPDIKVETNESFEASGLDNIIEQAILELQ